MEKNKLDTKELIILNHSGGLDSSTLLARALVEGKTCLPINYNYGQVNIVEMQAQQNVWQHFKDIYGDQLLDTIVIDFTSTVGDVIKTFRENVENGHAEETTDMKYYMPSRNLLFMSMAAVVGEIIANDKLITKLSLGLGIHQHSDIYAKDYWDISPQFASKLSDLLDLNDNLDVEIYAPYKDGYKSEIVKDCKTFKVPYKKTWTCYEPFKLQTWNDGTKIGDPIYQRYVPCYSCEACLERETQAKGIIDDINDYSTDVQIGVL